ncbi:MAG: hypothetical protein ACLPUG_13710 [Acidimicrobiales bacterium]
MAKTKPFKAPVIPDRPDDSTAKGGLAEEQHRARGRTRTAYKFNKVGVKRRQQKANTVAAPIDKSTPIY